MSAPHARSPVDPLMVSVAEMARVLSISRQQAYRLLDKKVVESRYLGGRRVVPIDALHAYVANLPRERAS